MSDREYEILSFIRSKKYVLWNDVLNAFNPETDVISNNAILHNALSSGKIETGWATEKPPHCSIRLTQEGVLALLEAEEERTSQESIRQENVRKKQEEQEEKRRILEAERTERKKEKRSDRRFQLFLTILQAFLSFVAGLLVEHFVGIISFIIGLF